MPKHVTPRRLGVGALVAATATFAGPAMAGAETPPELELAAALAPESDVQGLQVGLDNGQREQTILFGLVADDGARLKTYCVEFDMPLDTDHPEMEEVGWDAYPDPDSPFHENRHKIHWILQNTYPNLALGEVEDAVGESFDGGLSQEEAIAATQAAIWHYSDGVGLDDNNPTPGNAASADDVLLLYGFLTGEDNIGDEAPPEPELQLTPTSLEGEAGTAIGPFEVATTADEVAVTPHLPSGVTLTDESGQPLSDQVGDGAAIFVDVPPDSEPGAGMFVLKAMAERSVGRLFIGAEYKKHPTQSMILAASEKSELTAKGKVHWKAPTPTPPPTETPTPSETPTPTPTEVPTPTETPAPIETPGPSQELPDTGASPSLTLAAAGAAIGAAVLLLLRRRFAGARD